MQLSRNHPIIVYPHELRHTYDRFWRVAITEYTVIEHTFMTPLQKAFLPVTIQLSAPLPPILGVTNACSPLSRLGEGQGA
jgi:hypothetical protein